MRFAILMTDIEGEWDALPEARQEQILAEHQAFKRALESAGAFVAALHFHPRHEAKTVRQEADGSTSTRDGPFSDAREYVGGIYVIEAGSMDEAAEWARRGRFMPGANEVRQIHG